MNLELDKNSCGYNKTVIALKSSSVDEKIFLETSQNNPSLKLNDYMLEMSKIPSFRDEKD
eukprot:snap_masked-scaffold_25-processed-gene-0.34-mRNA-1 protein AED:1.00 eAED:1.00 QI:0/-1/0/0/-1/1/1/0/59